MMYVLTFEYVNIYIFRRCHILVLLHAVYLTPDVIGVAVARQVGAVLWPISEISTLPVQIVDL